jgi:hypothetical protein
MFFDAFTISGAIVALVLVVATLWSTGCCRKRS